MMRTLYVNTYVRSPNPFCLNQNMKLIKKL